MILRTGPRVRWPLERIEADHSLLGIMVDTAARNGHADIGSILAFAGLSSTNGVGPAMRDPAARARLAHVLDQPPEVVDARAHLPAATVGGMDAVDFFGARVPAHDLLHKRRRVGRTDVGGFHHRAGWQLVAMPVCPSTGAEVRDTCRSCGAGLGWRYTADAASCPGRDRPGRAGGRRDDLDRRHDCCREGAGANDAPPTASPDQLASITPLTDLLDPRPEVHTAARDALAPDLRGEDRGVVFYLAARLGRALALGGSASRLRRSAAPPVDDALASLAMGATVLAGWPDGVAEIIGARAAESHEGALDALAAARRVCHGEGAWEEHRRLIAGAMPALVSGQNQRAMRSITADAVDGREAARMIGIQPNRIPAINRPDIITPLVSRGTEKVHGSFAVADVEPIAVAVRDSVEATTVSEAWGVTLHGIEQMICAGLLDRADHPAVTALYPNLRITASSRDRLADRLSASAAERLPDDAATIPLRTALLGVGGREKPWAAILDALAGGRVAFTLRTGRGRLAERIGVQPGPALDAVLATRFDRAAHPSFGFATTMRRRDACELLNIYAYRLAAIEGSLPADVHARVRTLRVAPLIAVAEAVIDRREAGARWGVRLRNDDALADGMGWSRQAVELAHGPAGSTGR